MSTQVVLITGGLTGIGRAAAVVTDPARALSFAPRPVKGRPSMKIAGPDAIRSKSCPSVAPIVSTSAF
jgi:hypothetical protein